MFCHFRSKIRVCGNRCNTLSFKDEDNRKMPVDAKKNKLQNCYLGFSKFWKFWKFRNIFNFLFLQKKNSTFSKKRNICTRRVSKECMYQVSSDSLHKRCFYSILNVKNGYFSGHLDVMQCNSKYSFYSDFYATNDVLRSFFRVLDEKPTHKHVLRRQMTEIGNLTSWPQMTLTSE